MNLGRHGWIEWFALIPLLMQGIAVAQQSTGDILGAVTDGRGALIAGALVTLVNMGTHETRTTHTTSSGEFAASDLQPGIYVITFSANGFKTVSENSIELTVGARARINVSLPAGAASETVTVHGTAPAIQTDTSVVSTTITQQQTEDLPLNGRNFIQLAQMAVGANEGPPDSITNGRALDDRRQTAAISVDGQSEFLNNQTIDGVDNNERLIGTIAVHPSIESISEIDIQTNSYAAQTGRTGGGVIDIITKSGTNSFHGSAFEFFRNDIFDASYDNLAALKQSKTELRQNQFGASLGGPIIRNDTFFFGDYEGYRQVRGLALQQLEVPTKAEHDAVLAGGTPDFADYPSYAPVFGGFYPIDPVGRAYFLMFPSPNDPLDAGYFDGALKQFQNSHTFDARVDHHLTGSDALFARFIYNNVSTTDEGPFPSVTVAGLNLNPNSIFTGATGIATDVDYNSSIGYQHIFNSSLLLDFRVSYSRVDNRNKPDTVGLNPNQMLRQPNVNTPIGGATGLAPATVLENGFASLGRTFFSPLKDQDNTFEYLGSMAYNRGVHGMKFGAGVIRRQLVSFQSEFPAGWWQFLTFGDLLHGADINAMRSLQYTARANETPTAGSAPHLRVWEPSVFAHDDWRIGRRLTLNVGLRYEVFTPFTEVRNLAANFDPVSQDEIVAGQNGTRPSAGVQTDFNGLSPRFGFAFTPRSRTVIRGGFGMSYVPGNTTSVANLKNPPFVDAEACGIFSPCVAGTNGQFQYGFSAIGPTTIDSPNATVPAAVDLHFRTSTFEQYNLTIQKELGENVISISYIGLQGRQLDQGIGDLNSPGANSCSISGSNDATCMNPLRPFYAKHPNLTTVGYLQSHGTSNFNAVQGTIEHRLTHGLFFNFNYQHEHNLDDAPEISQDGRGGTGQQPHNTRVDYGNSGLDYRNRFAGFAGFLLPVGRTRRELTETLIRGWHVNTILAFTSGTPFTVVNSNPQSNAEPGAADRPNMTGDPRQSDPGIHHYFNPEAFSVNAFGTYGTERSNQLFGPWYRHADLSLFKVFSLPRETKLQLRVECFNISNTPSFNTPNATLPAPTAQTVTAQNITDVSSNPTKFGWITSTQYNYAPRQWQVAMRLAF
jgi:hypothetical protein